MTCVFIVLAGTLFCRLNPSDYVQSKEHIQLAHDMAAQTIVMLKNVQSKGLPITSPYKKACVSVKDSKVGESLTVLAHILYFSYMHTHPDHWTFHRYSKFTIW